MTTEVLQPGPPAAGTSDAPRRLGGSLSARYDVDNFIIGFLIMYMLVYVSELLILVPCGSFQDLASCDLPAAAKGFWSSYFETDPLFAQMPPYYAMIMSIQDFLYNPWWALCLFMFWTGRQEAPWHKTITILVSGMIIATGLLNFGVQLQHPHYTPTIMVALLLINGPWIAGPLLFSWRLRHREPRSVSSGRPSGTRGRGLTMIGIPIVGYVAFCVVAEMIA